jgi:TolB-like protein
MEVGMKRRIFFAGMMIWPILWLGCTSIPMKKESDAGVVKRSPISLPAEVLKVEGDQIILRMEKPAPLKEKDKLAVSLAQGVIDSSYLLEGKEVFLNQTRAKVMRIVGNEAQVKSSEKTHPFRARDRVSITLEKKIIALKDFEVVVGRNKDVAKYLQEDLTTLLVDSGQFSVVERRKLGTILEEIQLGQTGMIDPTTAQKAGKLIGAELILTGTLVASENEWIVNLRLVNTETGLIIAAIHKKGPLQELNTEAFRDTQNLGGSFENENFELAGWMMGTIREGRTGKGGFQRIYVDKDEGANGTKQSLAMEFKLGSETIRQHKNENAQAQFRNHLKRDLGKYTGIKFFIKGSDHFTLRFHLTIMDKNLKEEVNWIRTVVVTKEWREIRFPFTSLAARGGKSPQSGRTQVIDNLDLRNVEKIEWLADERHMKLGSNGTIWLDEISFY